jgi:two-component system, cell cycle sensor histidine kinase and response regulator CckA
MRGSRILVVEDERIVGEDIRLMLEDLGYEIVGVVSTGEEAVQKAEEMKPDLALMDIVLAGEIDGIEAAKQMRAVWNVPVIYLTAYSSQCTQNRTQETDPFGYLVKPFKRSDLRCAIETALYKHDMEMRLRKSEQKFRLLYENVPSAYQSLDDRGLLLEVNEAWLDLFGYSREEVINKSFGDFLAPTYRGGSCGGILARDSEGRLQGVELEMVKKDGAPVTVLLDGIVVGDGDGKFKSHHILHNVTERNKSQAEQKWLATAVEQSAEAIVIADKDGNTQYVNPAFERISGYSRREIVGKKLSPLAGSDYNEALQRQLWKTITRGEVWNGRLESKKKDGTVYFEDTTIAPVRDARGDIANFVAVKRDVTREVLLEKELLHAQKMEAVGTLAGGIAHDFNNLLTVVLGYSEYLLMDGDIGESARGDLSKLNQAAQKGAELVQSLLTFSRKVEPKLSPTNLNHQVEQVKNLLERTLPKKINISVSLEKGLDIIHADSSQVQQVLMNLAVNAKDAMPNGGKLTIQTANAVIDEEFCRSHLGAKCGRYAMVSVSDTGHGMDKQILGHIFEPFYTTKGMGRGTGLGLAMTYGIVKQHAGYIECESVVGAGTTFRVYLPVPDADAPDEDIQEKPALPGGPETVLLVDDEDSIRDLVQKVLVRAGYSVLTASNGQEALELYKRESGRISLVILDLVMPEMSGAQCLEELVRIDPNARALIASGSSPDRFTTEGLEQLAKGFVWKPYNISQLLHAVRRALEGE